MPTVQDKIKGAILCPICKKERLSHMKELQGSHPCDVIIAEDIF